jgi:rare lipoprotein A
VAPLRVGALTLVAVLLGACASRPGIERDGPPAQVPEGLLLVPGAVPRVEPLRAGGPNKPYEVAGQTYVPMTADLPWKESGGASWYGRKYHGRPTSSGEIYDMFGMTAAHKTLPIPSYVRVRNPANGRELLLRVNDRGPFAEGRVIDLSYTAALQLGVLGGVAPVQVQRLTHEDIRRLASGSETRGPGGRSSGDEAERARALLEGH